MSVQKYWKLPLGCVHTERGSNLSHDQITFKVNGSMRLDALSRCTTLAVVPGTLALGLQLPTLQCR